MRFAALLLLLIAPLAAAQTITPRGNAGTLDVASWNLEFFGTTSAGSFDTSPPDAGQFHNVKEVIRQGGIDLWAFQEVSDGADFVALRDSIQSHGYAVVLGPNVSDPNTPFDQKLAFAYNTSVLRVYGQRTILSGDSYSFAGRLPLELQATATLDGTTRDLRIITFHAKAGGTSSDRSRRASAAAALKGYTDVLLGSGIDVIVLGDFNDELTTSISGGTSPYADFVSSPDYHFATQALNDTNTPTYCGSSSTCSSGSTIDHILISNLLYARVEEEDRYGELIAALPTYTRTTSDHLPVLARINIGTIVDAETAPETRPVALTVPNPMRGTASLTVRLDASADLTLDVFDVRGRRIARLAEGTFGASAHRVAWDTDGLAPGLYVVRLQAGPEAVARTVAVVR